MSWLERPVKGVLLDISGVLRNGDEAIPGSIDAFERLQKSGIPVRLVTNESQVSRDGSYSKLIKLGFKDIEMDHVSAPGPIMAALIRENKLKPHFLVHPGLMKEFEGLDKFEGKPNCVVMADAAHHFNYDNINAAFRVLLDMKHRGEEPKLYTLGKGRFYKENDNLLWLDVGPYAAGLEYALDIKAELVGKPAKTFFHGALEKISVLPEDAVMIGDDIVGDVQGAIDAGLRGVLVRTGKFRPSDENHPVVTPSAIVDNLAQAVDLILEKNQSK